MTEQIERRLEELKAEFEAGRALLADLESRRSRVRSSMLRIGGAIRVLEELLGRAPEVGSREAPGGVAREG
jgi:hypothetical protein